MAKLQTCTWLLLSFVSVIVQAANNPYDNYYSDDIFDAIQEAKKQPHHYDYSREKRYNRTTTQSIEIPKLLNSEMESTSIESDSNSAVNSSAVDVVTNSTSSDELNQYPTGISNNNSNAPTTALPIGNTNVIAPNVNTTVRAR